MAAADTIPVIDLGPCLAGEPGALDRTARELRVALTEIGFYFIVNHGVPREKIRAAFEQTKRFHAQPVEKKLALKIDKNSTGYLPMRGNTLRTSTVQSGTKPNLNEAFFVKRELPADHPDVLANRRFRGANRWPSDLPGFREIIVDYCQTMERLVQQMVRVYARALELPANYFDAPFRESQYSLRMTHYPHQDGPVEDEFGLAPHTDTVARTQRRARPLDPHAERQMDRRPRHSRRLCRQWRPDAAALDQRPLPRHAAPRHQPERRRALCAALLLRQQHRLADRRRADLCRAGPAAEISDHGLYGLHDLVSETEL